MDTIVHRFQSIGSIWRRISSVKRSPCIFSSFKLDATRHVCFVSWIGWGAQRVFIWIRIIYLQTKQSIRDYMYIAWRRYTCSKSHWWFSVCYVTKCTEIPGCLKPLNDVLQTRSAYQSASVGDYTLCDCRQWYSFLKEVEKGLLVPTVFLTYTPGGAGVLSIITSFGESLRLLM